MELINASTTRMIEVEIFTVPALFTPYRVDRTTIPSGLTCYEVSKDPFFVAEQVNENFYGTLLTPVPLELSQEGRRWIGIGELMADPSWGRHTPDEFEEKYLSPHDEE